MQRMRLSRIVVRRATAPGTALDPAPAGCLGVARGRDRSTRAADVVWRSSRTPGRRVEADARPVGPGATSSMGTPAA
jgi:hypothetical protein